ncbi:MAG: MFS transporter [Anaerolineales bacterium]|nr:MFS transporter [Anaerolineales bacterium]
MGSVLVIVSALLVFVFIREPKVYEPAEAQPSLLASVREVLADRDRSALRLLLAILFWFIGYSAIEAFFNLYATNHLGLTEANGSRLLGELSLIFVLAALPAGYLGGKFGRRPLIMTGLVLMAALIAAIYLLPRATLLTPLAPLPAIGVSLAAGAPGRLIVLGGLLMLAGVAWAFININSLPMVVDMTSAARLGTYTGLYYLFSTAANILGPNLNGWIVQVTGRDYNNIMFAAPLFLLAALALMFGVRRGEAVPTVAQ